MNSSIVDDLARLFKVRYIPLNRDLSAIDNVCLLDIYTTETQILIRNCDTSVKALIMLQDKLPYRIKSVYLCELAFEPDPVKDYGGNGNA